MSNPGFFHLQTPEDLLRKIVRDLRRMQANPADSDAAFDFFVTANHIPDWLKNAGRPYAKPAAGTRDRALVDICSHLGNGAKHFVVNQHDAVDHGEVARTEVHMPATFGGAFFGASTFGGGLSVVNEDLVVTLAGDEASALGAREFRAVDLARAVAEYWSTYLAVAI